MGMIVVEINASDKQTLSRVTGPWRGLAPARASRPTPATSVAGRIVSYLRHRQKRSSYPSGGPWSHWKSASLRRQATLQTWRERRLWAAWSRVRPP